MPYSQALAEAVAGRAAMINNPSINWPKTRENLKLFDEQIERFIELQEKAIKSGACACHCSDFATTFRTTYSVPQDPAKKLNE